MYVLRTVGTTLFDTIRLFSQPGKLFKKSGHAGEEFASKLFRPNGACAVQVKLGKTFCEFYSRGGYNIIRLSGSLVYTPRARLRNVAETTSVESHAVFTVRFRSERAFGAERSPNDRIMFFHTLFRRNRSLRGVGIPQRNIRFWFFNNSRRNSFRYTSIVFRAVCRKRRTHHRIRLSVVFSSGKSGKKKKVEKHDLMIRRGCERFLKCYVFSEFRLKKLSWSYIS